MQNSLLNTHVTTIDGEATTLEKYAGKVLLIVNVASRCGLTSQYEQLENIHKAWQIGGLSCWAFPAISLWGRNQAVKKRLKPTAPTPGA